MDQHWTFAIQGHELKVEPICLFHPSIQIANGGEVREILDGDVEQEIRVEIQPTDSTPFRAFLPDVVLDPLTVLVPGPLDIIDLSEHRALAQIRANMFTAQDRREIESAAHAGDTGLPDVSE